MRQDTCGLIKYMSELKIINLKLGLNGGIKIGAILAMSA